MTVIPASKSDAGLNIADTLADIIGWSDDPDPSPLSQEWFDSYKSLIDRVADAATRSFADDTVIQQSIRNTRKLTVQFLGLMFRHPELSTVAVANWPEVHQKLVAALVDRRLEFLSMSQVTPKAATLVDENEWVLRRKELNETVEDQMMVLFKKDSRTAAMYSPEIAQILGCSEQSVRKRDNRVWRMFKAEKEANMARLTRRHTPDNRGDNDDE